MKIFLTISIIFFALLQIHAQVKNAMLDSLTERIEKHVDSTALKINNAADKIKNRVQSTQHAVDQKLKGDFKNKNTNAEVDSTDLKRKRADDKIKLQAQQAEHKFDSIMQTQNRHKINQTVILDSTNKVMDAGVDKIKAKSQAVESRIDSVNQKVIDGVHSKLSRMDSVQKKLDHSQAKLDHAKANVEQKQKHYTDSLNAVVQKYEQKLQTNRITHNVDSLKNMAQPLNKYKTKLDSISNVNPLQKTQTGMTQAESKIQNMTNEPKAKIDEKLNLLSKESGEKGNVPGGVNVPNADLNAVTGKIASDIKLPDTNLKPNTNLNIDPKLPTLNQPSIKNPDLPVNKDLNTKLNLPKDLDKAADLNKLNDLKKGTDEVTKASGKITGYTDDVKNIEKGDVEKVKTLKEDAMAKLPVKDELTEIQKQDKLLKEQQAKLESFKNPEEYKRQTLARSQEMVAKQMALYEKQIQASVDKLSKYQSKMGTILSKRGDLPKKRDMLKRLTMAEKFVPGLTLQIQKPGAWLVDINPSLRYRLTSYWSIGTGWNERVLFGKYQLTSDQARVYGVRSFTEVVIFRGLSARLDAEDMNTFIVPNQQTQDVGKRVWIWSYMAGIKKEFSFVPKVIGNVQFMYNLFSSHSDNVYPTRFNVRFGFESVLTKRFKKHKV